ncbi:anti-sigma B factor RsbW [bacterium]|nr:anti-sigma B factor RsbW [bacterium]
MTSQTVCIQIPAISDFVGVVRLAVSGVASRMQFSLDDIEDIKVAVSEACTNAVQHAYGSVNGFIDVEMTLHSDKLEIVVRDSGKGFDPDNAVSDKKDGANNELFGLGLGLTFIKTLMDFSEIKSTSSGTVVRMVKNAPPVSIPA